jgi:signal peptidase I
MMSAKKTSAPRKKRSEGKLIPALCNIVGTVLFAAVLLLTLPLAAPRLLGYDVFDVLSGSMEPELPVGSAVYVRAVEPTEVDVDEVIAFYNSEGNVVVHRVVTTHVSDYDFIDERHLFPGEGKNNWQEILTALENAGYEGTWNYEIKNSNSFAGSVYKDNHNRLLSGEIK